MKRIAADIVVIGGGPAGLAAALKAKALGAAKVMLIERDTELGGILQQCIHRRFRYPPLRQAYERQPVCTGFYRRVGAHRY